VIQSPSDAPLRHPGAPGVGGMWPTAARAGGASSRGRAALGLVLMASGAGLLLLTASWYVAPWPDRSAHKDVARRLPIAAPPPEVAGLRSIEDLANAVLREGPAPPRELARRASALVDARFDTCHGSAFTFQQNWIAAAMGLVEPTYGLHTSAHAIRYADCSLCGEVNGTLVRVLGRLGVPARLFVVPGHVLAEVEWDGSWHVVDPHYGYFPEARFAPDAAALAGDPRLVDAVYRGRIPPDVLALTLHAFADFRADDPATGPRPVQRDNAPNVATAHQVAEVAKWILPALAIAVGSLLRRRARRADAGALSQGAPRA